MPLLFLALLVILLILLLSLKKPTNDAPWKPDYARMAHGEIEGDTLTIHNIRNTYYPTPEDVDNPPDYTVEWETRQYDLNKVKRLWYVVESFTNFEVVAHTLLSFEFEGGEFLAVSVEARLKQDQSYGITTGLLRNFELSYLFGDECDLLGRRAVYQGHDVYLYPLVTPAWEVREVLEQMVAEANRLLDKPQFYNSITKNCTNALLRHANRVRPDSFRWWEPAQVLPGLSDKMLYEKGWIATDVPQKRLREHFQIKDKARKYKDDPDFSEKIRAGM